MIQYAVGIHDVGNPDGPPINPVMYPTLEDAEGALEEMELGSGQTCEISMYIGGKYNGGAYAKNTAN